MKWGPKLFKDYRLYVAAEADDDLAYRLTHIGEDNISWARITATRVNPKKMEWWV